MKKLSLKFYIFLMLLIAVIFATTPTVATSVYAGSKFFPIDDYNCYRYEGKVPHFFTHEIINNPQVAFHSRLSHHYDKDCITHNEFLSFLNQMYDNNYCLVDIYDVVAFDNGIPYFKELFVPIGKKPFLLSFDDMSYDSKGLGLSDKIIIDENGNLASQTQNNEKQIEYDKEAFCILENFIHLHPDFSFRNARAIVCPTGYNGLLGYRINKGAKDRETEIENLKPVVEKLKSLNYRFASHTYNHIQVAYASDNNLYEDCKKYEEEIISIIGKTDLFCFPCGSLVTSGNKLKILNSFGYKIFFCVGDAKTQEKNNSVFMKREVLNGVSLRNYRKQYSAYFDTKEVYDHENRKLPFPKGA